MNISEYVIERVKLESNRESPLMFGGNKWNFLPDIFNWAGFTVGAEIGVSGGRFSARLCRTVPGLKMFAIDPWKHNEDYMPRYSQKDMDRTHRKAVARLEPFNCEIIREYSADAVGRFEDNQLDFVYIDADRRFEHVVEDLAAWTDKVRPGGIISGTAYHNYNDHNVGRVKDAVDAWTRANGIVPWFLVVHYRYPVYFWEKR